MAFDHHRIHQRAAILDDDVIENLDRADFGVDGHDRGMRGIAERTGVAFGAKADGGLEPAEVDIGRQLLRPQIPGFGDVAQ